MSVKLKALAARGTKGKLKVSEYWEVFDDIAAAAPNQDSIFPGTRDHCEPISFGHVLGLRGIMILGRNGFGDYLLEMVSDDDHSEVCAPSHVVWNLDRELKSMSGVFW